MTHRTMLGAGFVFTTMLAACSQGQSAPSAAPETPIYGTTTGELACDEFVSLAKACVDKGRMGAVAKGRAELEVVQRTLRDLVSGAPIALDHRAVWSSAVRATRLHKAMSLAAEKDSDKRELVVDAIPSGELCKHAIDQLPTECQ